MKVLAVTVFEVVNNGLQDRFDLSKPHEQRLSCSGPRVDVVSQHYWIDVRDPLATELLLRNIGEVKEVNITEL